MDSFFFRGVSTTVSVSVFQTDDAGSIPVHRSIRFHAYWEFPVGSHDHESRVRYPRLRLFDGHVDIVSAHHSRMMRTALRRKGRRESDQPIRPVRKRFPGTWVTAFLVSRPTGCGNGLGGAWEFSPRDPCHASCCSMRVHRKHECKDSTRVAGSIVDCAGISLRIACACFRGPTGRGDALRTHSVRVRIPSRHDGPSVRM